VAQQLTAPRSNRIGWPFFLGVHEIVHGRRRNHQRRGRPLYQGSAPTEEGWPSRFSGMLRQGGPSSGQGDLEVGRRSPATGSLQPLIQATPPLPDRTVHPRLHRSH
jgi:hypothetical protein